MTDLTDESITTATIPISSTSGSGDESRSRRSLITQLQSLNPSMSGAEIGRLLGCTRERVRAILGSGVLKRSGAVSTLHVNLGEELRADIAQASEGYGSISGWCRTLLSLACFLKLAGVDPIEILAMRAKEVEALKSFETKEMPDGD
jgi:hypothetical protein